MPLTPQSQAVAILNQINSTCVDLANVIQLASQWPDITAILEALATCAPNADGSLGTPDDSPVSSHPLNTGAIPGLNRAATPAQYAAAKGYILAIVGIMNTGPNNATIAPFLGG